MPTARRRSVFWSARCSWSPRADRCLYRASWRAWEIAHKDFCRACYEDACLGELRKDAIRTRRAKA